MLLWCFRCFCAFAYGTPICTGHARQYLYRRRCSPGGIVARACGTELDVTKRILVVDDRSELLHLMRRVLEDEQYQVSIVQDGKTAFPRVKSMVPDLLILDLKLGDMSGQDVLKEVKSDPTTADVPVIVYTAAVLEAEEVSKLIESNPQFYSSVHLLRKPFELTALLDKVEELLDNSGH